MAAIGKVTCSACGADGADVNEGKGGTLSIACRASDCKALTMVKNPSAVAKLRARLDAAKSSPAPSSAAGLRDAGKDIDDFLRGGK